MSRFHSYLNTSKQFITSYNGNEPFSSFIKKQFALTKKSGSTDRKQIAHLCFCYFRLGKAFSDSLLEERILIGLFLCSYDSNEILQHLKPEWNEQVHLPLQEKLKFIQLPFTVGDVVPFIDELSKDVQADAFALSHFIQTDLFLRIRPGHKEIVLDHLAKSSVKYQLINESCIALQNTTKLDGLIQLNKEAVVQDYNSQRVGDLLLKYQSRFGKKKIEVWDCCAASGGKSILAYDLLPNIELTVSDIRDSILVNLQKRFEEAEIKKYNSLVLDLSVEQYKRAANSFQLIIADVPCTGSGTWGRTPENLSFFKKQKIEEFALLQKKMISNIIPSLKQNGYLLYITCSVFQKENEDVVAYMQEAFQLKLIEMNLLKGYALKADTMFATLLIKKDDSLDS